MGQINPHVDVLVVIVVVMNREVLLDRVGVLPLSQLNGREDNANSMGGPGQELISRSPTVPACPRLPGRNGNRSRRHWISESGGLQSATNQSG